MTETFLWKVSLCRVGSDNVNELSLHAVANDIHGAIALAEKFRDDTNDTEPDIKYIVSSAVLVDWYTMGCANE